MLAGLISPLSAQVVADGATNTLSNLTNSIVGGVTVGTNSSFTLLTLANNSLLSNSLEGNIGLNATARSNEVRLTSPSARWLMGGSLFIGYNGAGNRLTVSNGGLVSNQAAVLGQIISSSNNVAVVTGAGSAWTNSGTLYVGGIGPGNRLLISDGATVRDGSGLVGLNASSSNNQTTVTGPGSLWDQAGQFYIGFFSAGNQLVISNGGFVRANATVVGIGLGANSNLALVTGSSSVWSNASYLYVGSEGIGNRLIVSDGGAVWNTTGKVGSLADNNSAQLTGPGSSWTNTQHLFVGSSSSRNQLVASNGATVFTGGDGFIGYTLGANSNSAVLTDAGTRWLLSSNLYVGSNGAMNRLLISDGALVGNSIGTLGQSVSSSNNLAVVTSVGSKWTNSGDLIVGLEGAGNELVVSGGGTAWSGTGEIGNNSSSNLAVVTGVGSVWSNALDLLIGRSGSFNQLLISNGALVADVTGTLGQDLSSRGNLAVVAGAGSVWSNSGDLFVGLEGPGNQLEISNGGAVWANKGEIGANSSSNLAMVTGVGSVWSNAVDLLIGRGGSFNQLVVTNGGVVRSDNGYTYFSIASAASNNSVLVTGTGSKLITYGFSFESGWGNCVVITNGGWVECSDTYIGFDSAGQSSNNVVLITGAGSVWNNDGGLFVGYFGSGNQLVITNGGMLRGIGSVYLGVMPASTDNRVEINGGSLVASNEFGTAILNIRRGTNVLQAGLVDVNRLLMTNALGDFEFNGGTLRSGGTTNSNGRLFTVGNGTRAATFQLQGGSHSFANNLSVANHGALTGNGMVLGTVNVLTGGTLSPGPSMGKLSLNNSPVLQGNTVMEISRSGPVLTNDELQVNALFAYGGSLVVTNVGLSPLAAGDKFKLFSSSTYLGSFSTLTLPPLGFNLTWANKLAVDGSIEVVSGPVPQFNNVARSGSNLVLSGIGGIAGQSYTILSTTNIGLPLNQWSSAATNQFGAGGTFTFSNPIAPVTPQRFFRIRWP